MELIAAFQISITSLQNFLEQMENGYSKYGNPYHNLIHAADVLQTIYQIIYNSGLMVEVNTVS
jgi:calcium/calmodulin-dependent 3',5'-cyclic nucleotide phosphodiesterase